MTTFTHTLKPLSLSSAACIYQPPRPPLEVLTLAAPALAAMTDLRRTPVITTRAQTSIEQALELMVHAKVRLLLVIDAAEMIVGLVSAQDLMGVQPLRVASRERIRHDQVAVGQVMTPVADMQPLALADVSHATVRDVIAHLLATQRMHALVIETAQGGGRLTACGIFSATQIGRQLGRSIEPGDGRAQSFAELRRLIA